MTDFEKKINHFAKSFLAKNKLTGLSLKDFSNFLNKKVSKYLKKEYAGSIERNLDSNSDFEWFLEENGLNRTAIESESYKKQMLSLPDGWERTASPAAKAKVKQKAQSQAKSEMTSKAEELAEYLANRIVEEMEKSDFFKGLVQDKSATESMCEALKAQLMEPHEDEECVIAITVRFTSVIYIMMSLIKGKRSVKDAYAQTYETHPARPPRDMATS